MSGRWLSKIRGNREVWRKSIIGNQEEVAEGREGMRSKILVSFSSM